MKVDRPFKPTGRRLQNLSNLIKHTYPQDQWVLKPILPIFLSIIDSNSTIEQQEKVITSLNRVFNDYEFRYNTILETIIMSNEFKRMQELAGVPVTEAITPKKKKSLKENFVGFGAINNPFIEREKTDYEMAFDHYVNKNPIKEEETPVSEDVNDNPTDEIKLDVPLLIRLLEYAREDAKTDMDLHNVAERLIDLSRGGECLGMVDYEAIVGGFESGTEEMEETEI
jgi:hypothetical protein